MLDRSNKIRALHHEEILCTREFVVHLEQRRRQAFEEYLACDRDFRRELEALQKKERDLYGIKVAS